VRAGIHAEILLGAILEKELSSYSGEKENSPSAADARERTQPERAGNAPAGAGRNARRDAIFKWVGISLLLLIRKEKLYIVLSYYYFIPCW
jgi:hypothetical protein